MAGGLDPSRAFTLACLFTDLHLHLQKQPETPRLELLQEMRTRGFPRGETERMRLLLNALSRLLNPNRRLRGMHRRPYFAEAKALHEMLSPHYLTAAENGHDAAPSRRRRRRPSRRRRRRGPASARQQAPHEGGAAVAAADPAGSEMKEN